MKLLNTRFALFLFAALIISSACAQDTTTKPVAPKPVLGPSQGLLWMWKDVGRKLTAMAEDFPEDKYDFKPNPAQRSFAEQLIHVAHDINIFVEIGKGVKPHLDEPKRSDFKNKAAVVEYVRKAFADGAALIASKGDSGMNDLVIEQCAAEILALPIPKFLTWRSRRFLKPTENTYFLYTTYTGPKFARDAGGRLWEGATVTYVALQKAYHMGFEKVILIGVDHNFVTKGDANKTITSQGDDPNHFAPNYFGKGFKWQLPDLETSERAYRMAKTAFTADGREVLDATIGGKLTVFPKIDYLSLF